MPVIIRKAEKKDVPDIIRLTKQLAENSHIESPINTHFTEKFLENPLCHILLAEENGKITGFLSYSVKPNLFHAADSYLIEELIVDEACRGNGTGGMLVSFLMEDSKKNGCAEISVSTEFENKKAIEFYKKHGLDEEFLFLEKHF